MIIAEGGEKRNLQICGGRVELSVFCTMDTQDPTVEATCVAFSPIGNLKFPATKRVL